MCRPARERAGERPDADLAALPAARAAPFNFFVSETIAAQHRHVRMGLALAARTPASQPLTVVEEVLERGQWQRVHCRSMMRHRVRG